MSQILVRGVDDSAAVQVELALDHGADPAVVLSEKGWHVTRFVRAARVRSTLVVDFDVRPSQQSRPSHGSLPSRPIPRREVSEADAAGAEPYQRVAAYAVVTSDRGVLLTQLSGQTSRAGAWGLPGGGLDPEESPVDGVIREVWEETGQRVEVTDPLEVITEHWIGSSPDGRIEDFHAVRLIYRARCPEPTEPVVHDVGGTTSAAAWRTHDQGEDIIPWTRALLAASAE